MKIESFERHLDDEPWQTLAHLIDEGSRSDVQAFLGELTPAQTALVVSRLDADKQDALMRILSAEDVAEMLVDLPDEQAANLLQDLPAVEAAEIVDFLAPEQQADILARSEERRVGKECRL